jgi:ankyrin repeat protein
MAVRGANADAVTMLVARGADVNHRNENGATALGWARRGGFDAIEKTLLRAGAKN